MLKKHFPSKKPPTSLNCWVFTSDFQACRKRSMTAWYAYMLRLVFKKLFYLLDGWRGLKNKNTHIISNRYFFFVCSERLHKQAPHRTATHSPILTLCNSYPYTSFRHPIRTAALGTATCHIASPPAADLLPELSCALRLQSRAEYLLPPHSQQLRCVSPWGSAFRFRTAPAHAARSSLSAHDVFAFFP